MRKVSEKRQRTYTKGAGEFKKPVCVGKIREHPAWANSGRLTWGGLPLLLWTGSVSSKTEKQSPRSGRLAIEGLGEDLVSKKRKAEENLKKKLE